MRRELGTAALLAASLLAACGGGESGGQLSTAHAAGAAASHTRIGTNTSAAAAPPQRSALGIINTAPPVLRAEAAGRSVTFSWGAVNATQHELVLSSSAACNPAQAATCPDLQRISGVTSPHRLDGLVEGQLLFARLVAQTLAGPRISPAAAVLPVQVGVNGVVASSTIAADGRTYLGGNFTAAGMVSGQGVGLDAASGLLRRPDQAMFSGGAVRTALPDGSGGWFVGGDFQRVGGQPRRHLAHLFADERLDPGFDPSPDGAVRSLVTTGGTLYVGGTFTRIAGQQRIGLAALSPTGVLQAWNPNSDNGVFALATMDGVIYASGTFGTVGGVGRTRLAAIDAQGNLLPWSPGADNAVFALAAAGGRIYLGGSFTQIAGQPRGCLAAVGRDGELLPWNPRLTDCPAGQVNTIAVTPGAAPQVLVGGSFARVGAAGVARASLAAFDTNGLTLPWNPGSDGDVSALAFAAAATGTPARVLVGGRFGRLAGQARFNLGALDLQGTLLPWAPNPIAGVLALHSVGNEVFAGGEFTALRAVQRQGLLAMDASGALTAWAPRVSGVVRTLATSGNTVFVGGQFSSVNGQPRANLAAVGSDGQLRDWAAQTDGAVYTLAASGLRLYVGGQFTQVGGQPRPNLAAVQFSGAAFLWNPQVDGPVHAIAAAPASGLGDTLYVGGAFERINGQLRRRLAAFNDLGQLAAWNPHGGDNAAPASRVLALALDGATVYAGGNFGQVGPFGRRGLAAINGATGALLPWAPRADATVHSLLVQGGRVYAGGEFTQIGVGELAPLARRGGAAFLAEAADSTGTGTLDTWDPEVGGTVYTLAAAPGRIVLAGDFSQVRGQLAGSIAALSP